MMSVSVLRVAAQGPVQPANLLGQGDVDPGHVLLAAAHPEGDDAHLGVESVGGVGRVLGTDQRSPSVTPAGVTAGLAPGTNQGGVELEPPAQLGVAQPGLALGPAHHRHHHLLHHHRPGGLGSEVLLSPALKQ